MRLGLLLGGLTAAAIVLAGMAALGGTPPDPVKVRLVAATNTLSPGETTAVDVHFDIAPGWHIYWRNPGDSGLPTEIGWQLPPGFAAGAIAWPIPERFVVDAIGNYGYANSADLRTRITAPRNLAAGTTAPLRATAHWLACSSICIPGSAALALDLPVQTGAAAANPATGGFFARPERLPKPLPSRFAISFTAGAKTLHLSVPRTALAPLTAPVRASFFPFEQDIVDAAAAQTARPSSDAIDLILPRATGPTAHLPHTLAGLLVVRDGAGGEHAFTLRAEPGGGPTAGGRTTPIGWRQALLLAFVGGAILNLMPCVFPVLALKLLGFAVSVRRAEERRHAAAYALGIVVSFAALGGALLLLRAGGAAIGWGFQLQSPVVVALLAYLLFALGLSLCGVAEFGAGFGGIGERFADRGGIAGAFATGVLAAIVATPCTAPFMGAALGFALVAPPPLALATVIAVGAGLAAPVVLAAAIPGAVRLLPRPGPWMLWFKQLLAFPLFATVAWLVWVLVQEATPAACFFGLAGLVAVGFAVWIYGRTRAATTVGRRLGSGLAALGTAAGFVAAIMLAPGGGTQAASPARAAGLAYQRFAPDRLDALLAAHKPVFVNLTAAWCLTCLVNEHATLDSAAVRRAFADRGITALRGDWTRQDAQITEFLQQFGRSGVPLYVLYDTRGQPTVLPQILTQNDVLAAIGRG